MKKTILNELPLKDLIHIYESFWGTPKRAYDRDSLVAHISAYIELWYSFEHLVVDEEKKHYYRSKALNIGKLINKYRKLSLIEYNKLQIELIKKSELEPQVWIAFYGELVHHLVYDLRINDMDVLLKFICERGGKYD